jgi:hypothetical protein
VKLWRAANAAGWQTQRLGRWHADDYLRTLEPSDIAVYGGFFIALAGELGISLLEPAVDWLARLSTDFTRRTVRFMNFAQARRLPDRAFYKPADDKTFLAKVYESGDQLILGGELSDDLPVLVSEIVSWAIEFRCFVREGRVVALSPYLRNHERIETDEGSFYASEEEFSAARSFAADMLATHASTLPPAVVVDVGLISDRGWAVIEANSAWSAGIYGCDPLAVLPVLRRACVATSELATQDRRWLTER